LSGIKPLQWIESLVNLKQQQGLRDGPAISDANGRVMTISSLNGALYEVLEEVYEANPECFPLSIKSKEDIYSSYGVYRSFRRASDTKALNEDVRQDDIDLVNRWHQVEKVGGKRPAFNKRHHYAQYELLIEPFLRYTSAM
jgi:hypothetical protein